VVGSRTLRGARGPDVIPRRLWEPLRSAIVRQSAPPPNQSSSLPFPSSEASSVVMSSMVARMPLTILCHTRDGGRGNRVRKVRPTHFNFFFTTFSTRSSVHGTDISRLQPTIQRESQWKKHQTGRETPLLGGQSASLTDRETAANSWAPQHHPVPHPSRPEASGPPGRIGQPAPITAR